MLLKKKNPLPSGRGVSIREEKSDSAENLNLTPKHIALGLRTLLKEKL